MSTFKTGNFVTAFPRTRTEKLETHKKKTEAEQKFNLNEIIVHKTSQGPQRFIKAVPPSSRFLHVAEPPTSSEESSEAVKIEFSSSDLEQSTEKTQNEVNQERDSAQNAGQLSVSEKQISTSEPWKPDAETLRRRSQAQRRKGVVRSTKAVLQRQPAMHGLNRSESSNSKPPLNTTIELDLSPSSPGTAKQQEPSSNRKTDIFELIPNFDARTFKKGAPETKAKAAKFDTRMTKQLVKSELYSEASRAQALPEEMGVTMCPKILESYLASLLKDAPARQTIKNCKLTAPEAVAVRYYGREGFQFVQPSLRGKPDPSLGPRFAPAGSFDNLVAQCAGAFAKLPPFPPGTQLFRGTNFLFDETLEVDQTYLDPAFVSASTSMDVAQGKFAGKYLLIYEVPEKDPRFRDISSLTGNSKEAEGLGLPDIRFRVVSRGGDGGAAVGAGTPENPEIVRLSPIAII